MPSDDYQTCSRCGGARHIFPGECSRDLHGRADPFKTSCAVCETDIPSRAPRVGDKFGNLYCDIECMNRGYETLIERIDGDGTPTDDRAEVSVGG